MWPSDLRTQARAFLPQACFVITVARFVITVACFVITAA
jgi:hypothetical protein